MFFYFVFDLFQFLNGTVAAQVRCAAAVVKFQKNKRESQLDLSNSLHFASAQSSTQLVVVTVVVVVCFTYFEGFNTHLRAHNDLKDHDVDVSDDNIATRTKLGFDF